MAGLEATPGKETRKIMPPKLKTKPRRGEGVAFPLGTTVFDPNANWRMTWDQLCMVLLVICATLTPFEVSFLQGKGLPSPDLLWVFNHCIDLVFLTDMLINFNTAYFDFRASAWVVRRAKIVRSYVYGWFPIDLVSVLPFDDISFVVSDTCNASRGLHMKWIR